MTSLKAALGIALTVVVLLAFLLFMAPSEGKEATFTRDDRADLKEKYPGGRFLSDTTYERCENGTLIHYYATGKRIAGFGDCWK